jgi:two-component system, LytTR family, sensor kinase
MADEERRRQFWLEVALIFVVWTIFGLILTNQIAMQSQLRGTPVTWVEFMRHALFDSYLWAFATIAIFWLARRFPLERGRLLRNGAVHMLGALAMTGARIVLVVELSQLMEWLTPRTYSRQFLGSFHQHLIFYALLLGIAHAVLYHERYRERERAAERLLAGLTEARLHALKMQLQPHFLFNTLNAISALIPADAKPARRMVARLGDLLRTSLEHENTQEVTLREEIAFLQPYLEIEQARLEERLTVVMQISPDTLDARVPHLLLQPLVENAIRHGIAPRIEPGRVVISASRSADDRSLQLEVRDSGAGVERDNHSRTRKGVGLANVQSRLEQLYDGEHRFALENHPQGGVVVRISLPFRRGAGGDGITDSSPR